MELPETELKTIIQRALAEDLGRGDITTEILIPAALEGRAAFLVKDRGVLAGIDIARLVMQTVEPGLKFEVKIADGRRIKPGDVVATVAGPVAGILKAERTALNFLQRLSGIATATARYVSRVKDYNVDITDTRKTTPGLRVLEKYAVRMGGGLNHRGSLGAAVLIKDNHIAALRQKGMSLEEIVRKAKKQAPKRMVVEVEATSLKEALEGAAAGADVVMLDNLPPEEMARTVKKMPAGVRIEASGGITLVNVRQVAATGVNLISVGALTHSVKSLDISLELELSSLKIG